MITESRAYNHPVEVIGDTDDFVAVYKPHSLPVHAAGGCIQNYLMKQMVQRLFSAHWPDRVTSGIVVKGKSEAASKMFSELISTEEISEVYIARVIGVFPGDWEIIVDAPIIDTKENTCSA